MAEKIGLEAVFDLGDFNRGLSGYTSGLGKAERETSGMAGKMGQAWNTLGGTATKAAAVLAGAVVTAAAAAGAAIAGFAVSGIQKAADMEQGLSRIAAALNVTKDQVGPLKDLISDLGLDPTLKVSAVEAAQAIENLAKNGLSMQQILDGAARSTVLLANATGADFGQAADIATDVMQQFNIQASDMGRVVDGITAVTNMSKFSIDDYALALSQGGGVASTVGMEFEDFNTTIAAISPLFASGSDAGTSLKTMMLRLIPTTTAAEEAFGQLGLLTWDQTAAMQMLASAGIKPASDSLVDQIFALQDYFEKAYKVDLQTEEGIKKWGKWATEVGLMSNQFFDASGNLKSMAEITQVLHDATAGLSEEQKNQAFNTMFGTDAMRAAFATAESGAVVYTDAALAAKELGVSQEEVNKVIEGGVTKFEALQLQMAKIDAQEQAATRMDNFRGAMEILSGVIEAIQIQIGGIFLPILTELAKKLTELASTYGPSVVAFFQVFADNVSALANYIVALLEDGDYLNDWLTHMSPPLAAVVLGMVAFVGIVQQAADLIANSIGKFVEWKDILLVLGAAIATTVIPALVAMIAAIAPVVAIFAGAVLVVAALRTAWETNFLGIQDITKTAMQAVQDAIGPVIVALTGLAEKTIPFLEEHWRELAAGVAAFSAVLIAAQIPALLGAIGTAASALGVVIAGLSTPVLLVAAAIGILAAAWVGDWFGIQEATYSAIGAIMGQLAPLTDAIQQFGSGALAEITAFATGNATEFENVKAIWESAKESANNLFTTLVGYVTSHLSEWTAKFTEWGTAAWQWIVDATGQVTTKLGEWWTAISGYVTSHLSEWKTKFTEWATAAWQWIVDAAGVVATKLGEWYTALSTYIANQLPTWTTAFTNWAKAAWQWIVDAAGQVASKLGEWWTALKGALDDKLPTWITAFTDWIKAAWQWIVDAAGQVPSKLGEWYTALKGVLDDKLPTWVTAFKDWIEAAWQWILDSAALLPGKVGEWYTALKKAVDDKLPTWKAAFTDWKDATWQWIVDSAKNFPAKISEWYTKLTSDLGDKLPTFKTEMLKFATAMVTWIGDKAADALPELGKWLGHVIAWIPKAVIGLAIELVKLAAALIGWIMSPEADPDPEMEKFKTALGESLVKIGSGLKGFMGEFAKGFLEELGLGFLAEKDGLTRKLDELVDVMVEHLGLSDWVKYGQDILNNIRTGFESVRDAVYNGVTLVVERVKKIFNVIDEWLKIGKGILQNIWDGIISLKETVMTNIGTLIDNMKAKFTSLDFWTGVGKAIIEGIKKGLEEKGQEIIDYLVGLGQKALDAIKALFGIASPSTVFAAIGEDMIDGWLRGLQNRAPVLYRSIEQISNRLLDTVRQQRSSAVAAFSGLLGNFISAGDPFAEAQAARTNSGPSAGIRALANYQQVKKTFDILKQQADLVNLIRESGGDPGAILGHMNLGRNADPGIILQQITAATEQLTAQLEESLQVATRGYDQVVADLRRQRRSVEEIEAGFQSEHLTGLKAFEQRILDIDQRIADAESDLLAHGGDNRLAVLNQLQEFRNRTVGDMQTYLQQWRRINTTLGSIQSTSFERAQKAIDAFRETQIDPLIEEFQRATNDPGHRDYLQQLLNQRVATINEYVANAGNLAAVEKDIADLMEAANFSPATRRQIEDGLQTLYDVNTAIGSREGILASLQGYVRQAQSAFDLFGQIAGNDPLLGKLKTTLVEPLLAQLFDLNQTTSQRVDIYNRYRNAVNSLLTVERKQQAVSDLQERLDLVTKVKKLATDLKDTNLFARVFAGMDLTQALAPQDLATVLARYTDETIRLANRQLQEALRPRIDVDTQLAALRKRRETYAQIEDDFVNEPFSQLQKFQDLLAWYDTQIANAEQEAIDKNSQGFVNLVATLTENRQAVVDQTRDFLRQMYIARQIIGDISTRIDEAGATAAENFKAKYIDPLFAQMDAFGTLASRQIVLGQIRTQVDALNQFIVRINQLATIQRQMQAQTSPMEAALGEFYDPATTDARRQALLHYMQQIDAMMALERRAEQFTGELGDRFRNDVLNVLVGQISLRNISDQDRQSKLETLASYVNQFRSLQKVYDDLSAAVASSPLGDQDISGRFLDQFFDTNTTPAGRMQILASLSQYSSQFKALTSTYRSLSLVVENSPLSDRDISEQLLGRFFETGTTAAERTQIIASLRNYSAQFGALTNIVNRLATVVESSPFGERDISGQFLDRFFSLSSTDAQRQAILNDLTRYTGQFRTLSDAYRDVSTITSAYPLVGRFETQVMDRLLEQFFALNTSEAERLTIIQQYRQEQERILALQRRQQQLDFLRQQLDMVNTVKQLNEQFDDIISVQDILDGITFGINASMEDMLLLTSRVIEALIATTNYQLGISSPSKVFAKIGRRMMEGLGLGIENAASIPALALASVGQQVPYAMTNNRTANVYMGGQVINNGMDDATFTARVRRIVEGLL